MSAVPGATASMVRVTSVPDVVLRGAVIFTVPLALPPVSRDKLDGKVELKPWSLVAWILKVPPTPSVVKVKGTESGVPGTKTLSPSV